MCYAGGLHWRGVPIDVRDPKSALTTEIGRRHRDDPAGFVGEMLGIADIFGTDLIGSEAVKAALTTFVTQLRSMPAIDDVAALLHGG